MIEIEEQPDDQARLLGEQLTAGFDCPLTPEEKRRKLRRARVEQGGLFAAPVSDPQPKLF